MVSVRLLVVLGTVQLLCGFVNAVFQDSGAIFSRNGEKREENQLRRHVQEFAVPEELLPCLANMERADFNEDGLLDTLEYAVLVELESVGRVDEPFQLLPLDFVGLFHAHTCRSCPRLTGDPNCCIPSGFINLTAPGTEEFVDAVSYICYVVQYIISRLPDTEPPSDLPSSSPSDSPSQTPTDAAPSTSSPQEMPTAEPTGDLIDAPSDLPSSSPSSVGPTVEPSDAPSIVPSVVPSDHPSTFPTASPTMTPLLCLSISYRVDNGAGLTASDIINEVNNTVKSGLELAARTVTIDILNGTDTTPAPGQFTDILSIYPVSMEDAARFEGRYIVEGTDEAGRRDSLRYSRQLTQRRRLVFYTDDFPTQVQRAFDLTGEDCDEGLNCAIILHRVCVVLEPDDDIDELEALLTDGFREALESGAFQDAFPDDDIPIGPIGQ